MAAYSCRAYVQASVFVIEREQESVASGTS